MEKERKNASVLLKKSKIMQKLLLILLCLPMIGFGQNVYIPDANFKAYLVGEPSINTNGDNEIQVSEASAFNGGIYCTYMNIADLTGIEAFTAITNLHCYDNQLTSLDVSNNTALTDLSCGNNQLISLDVSNNTALDWLICYHNQLISLDVNGANSLINLECDNNQLISLDVSNNTALTYLTCRGNQLTSLAVNNNTALTMLKCESNQLTSLDVNSATSLIDFQCFNNYITSLDVSNNTALTYLYCGANQLNSLDVSNNTALTYLYCDTNQIISLDLTNNIALTRLDCSSNELTSLDVRNGNNTNVTQVFDATDNPNLTCINVDNYSLSTVNWIVASGNIDPQQHFSTNCPPPSSIQEHSTNKEILKVTDLLGRETKPKTNTPFIEIYDDGTVEKRIVIE